MPRRAETVLTVIVLIALPTVMYGGYSLLGLQASGGLTEFQNIVAPTGVVIESASIVAGRPNERAEPSRDRVVGGLPVVGLHVVGVPNGSMSHAQVALRLSRRGWHTTTLFASALTTFLLTAVALARPHSTSGGSQTSDIATALLTITAAVVAFVTKPPAPDGGAVGDDRPGRCRSRYDPLLTIGASISFGWRHELVFDGAAWIAGICTLLVGLAFFKARPRHDQISPWEQGLGERSAAADLPAMVLVRPDGSVAWAGDDDRSDLAHNAQSAITHWCGTSAHAEATEGSRASA